MHRLDARVKLLLLLASTVSLFCVGNVLMLAGVFVGSLVLLRRAGVPVIRLARSLGPLLVMFLVMIACNALRLDGSAGISIAGLMGIDVGGLMHGVATVLRICGLVVLSLVVSATTSVGELTDALLCLLGPLGRLRVPVEDVAMTLSIALRFIPVVSEQLQSVALAQRARGAAIGQGGPIRRVTSWVPVMIPVMVGLFRRSDALGLAMQARCYAGSGRTRLTSLQVRAADVAALVVGLAVCGLLAILF